MALELAADEERSFRGLHLGTEAPGIGKAEQQSARLRDGLGYSITSLKAGPRGLVSICCSPSLVRMSFHLSSEPGAGSSRLGDTSIVPAGLPEIWRVPPHGSMRRLDLFIRPCDFAARVPAGYVRSLSDGRGEEPSLHTTTMDSEMRRIVERIEHCPLNGTLRKVYLEGKVLELMALRLAQLSLPRPARTAPKLTAVQIKRLREAREIVAGNMRSPPSLKSLSREVAMSTTVMKCGFRALFGETVFQYLRGLRLERARDMLAGDGASAKEAAHAVGFASLSHFAKAFRERFGFSPHAWAAMSRVHSRTGS